MSSIDEALAQALAAEEEASQQWIQLSQYGTKEFYSDVDIPIDATQRTINDLSENISTMGENNAQYLSFMIDRYCDGIDLKDMRFRIQYMLESGVGSVGDVVNAYYNDQYIKFGWTIPIEATQTAGTIEIMVFCIGTVESAEYILKTKPVKYTIHNALPIGGGIPKPDENWFLSFVTDMDEKVATAQGYADSANQASQSAEQSKLSVDESKAHIDTVAAQVESNAEQSSTNAQSAAASATAAKESEEKAKQYVDNVLAISPAQVTDAVTVDPSFVGGLKVNQLYGKSEQKQYSGKNLLNMKNAIGGTSEGITVTVNMDGSYTYVGTATDSAINVWLLGNWIDSITKLTLPAGTYFIKGVNLYFNRNTIFDKGREGGILTVSSETKIGGVRVVGATAGQSYNETWFPIIALSNTEVPWEPYVGGIPSPNPDYPQEINSVVDPVVKVTGKNLIDYQNVQNGYELLGDGKLGQNKNYYVTDYIEIYNNVTYVMSGLSSDFYEVYDSEKNLLYGNRSTTFSIENKDAKYVRLNSKKENTTPQLEKGSIATAYEPYHEQSVTLTGVTLNAIPVSSGGNVTIDGQQYISDYVDVERWKIVRMVDGSKLDTTQSIIDKTEWLLATPTEESLSEELAEKLLALKTYAGVTNIFVSSTELSPMVELEYGAGTAGAYVLQALNLAKINELNIAALTTSNNTEATIE